MAQEDKITILIEAKVAEAISQLDKVKKGTDGVSKSTKTATQSFNDLAGKAVAIGAAFTATIAAMKSFIDASVKQEQALGKLRATAKGSGESFDKLKKATMQLTEDGMLSFADAAMAVSNLMATGLSLDEAVKGLKAAKTEAILNRQAHLSLGEAVVKFTEGIRNENSMLTDSIGYSENYSAAIQRVTKEKGLNTDALTRAEKAQLFLNEVIADSVKFEEAAADATNNYAGASAMLGNQMQQLQANIGEGLTRVLTPFLKLISQALALFIGLPKPIQSVTGAFVAMIPVALGLMAVLGPVGLIIGAIGAAGVAAGVGIASMRSEAEKLKEVDLDIADKLNAKAASMTIDALRKKIKELESALLESADATQTKKLFQDLQILQNALAQKSKIQADANRAAEIKAQKAHAEQAVKIQEQAAKLIESSNNATNESRLRQAEELIQSEMITEAQRTELMKIAIAERESIMSAAHDKRIAEEQKLQATIGQYISEGLAVASSYYDAFYNHRIEQINAEYDAELEALNKKYANRDTDAASMAAYNDELTKLEKKKQKETAQAEFDKAIFTRTASTFDIAMKTAQAIMGAVAASPLTGGLPWSAIVGGLGAAQIGAVWAQPLPTVPAFARGGVVPDDSMAMLNRREMVLPVELSDFIRNAASNASTTNNDNKTVNISFPNSDPFQVIDIIEQRGGRGILSRQR